MNGTSYNALLYYNAHREFNGAHFLPAPKQHGGISLDWSRERFDYWWENSRRVVIDAEEEDLAILMGAL